MDKTPKTDVKIIIPLLIIGTLVLTILLFNIENYCGCGHLFSSSTLGQFGDFYSGIIGTLFVIFGFYVLYRTYVYQRRQVELSVITALFDNIVADINDIEYKKNKGINALYKFDREHRLPENANSVMNHLMLVLTSFKHIIKITTNSKFLTEEIKQINLDRIYLLYNSKIIWPVFNSIFDVLYEDSMLEKDGKEIPVEGLKTHTDSPIIFENYKDLIKEAYGHLLLRKLIKRPKGCPKILEIIKDIKD